MPTNQNDSLFYIRQSHDDLYDLFNRMTDRMILSEVNKEEVESFLKINNPLHPFVRSTSVSERIYNHYTGVSSYGFTPSPYADTIPEWDVYNTESPQLEFDFADYLKSVEEKVSEMAEEDYPPWPEDDNEER